MIEIAGRRVGPSKLPYFVADIGANHDASLPRAKVLIDLAADAGADAVKFQSFKAPKIVSRRGFEELGRVGHQAGWKKSVYRTYLEATLPPDWLPVLAGHCAKAGVPFLTTPYDLETVDEVDPYVPAFKVGSGDITYLELIRHVAAKGKPVLLATGASDERDVDRAVGAVLDVTSAEREPDLVLMQCNSDYAGGASALSYLNLRAMPPWADYYGYCRLVGLSDHTPGDVAVCAAVALGASVVEKHFTDDRSRPGPDHAFAMTPDEWRQMVQRARLTWEALGDGEKRVEENEREARIVQRRALRYASDLKGGCELSRAEVLATRPCPEGALEPYRVDEVVGRRLRRGVEVDTLVRVEDFE